MRMSIDAFDLDQPADVGVDGNPRVLAKLHLEPGKNYVVFAKGDVYSAGAMVEATFRLEALLPEATDETTMVTQGFDEPYPAAHGSFSLSVAIALPPDPDLFVDAALWGHCSNSCSVRNVKIIALAVDSVTVTTS
jgi:hypothetical protein